MTEAIHLYIDDERPLPPQFTHLVRTPQEAIDFIAANRDNIATISFDHDMGWDGDELTTRPVMEWMRDNNFWPAQLFIHSASVWGAKWLYAFAMEHAPAEDAEYYEIVNDRNYYL